MSLDDETNSHAYWAGDQLMIPQSARAFIPELNTYGQSFFGRYFGGYGNRMLSRAAGLKMAKANDMNEPMAADDEYVAAEEVYLSAEMEDGGTFGDVRVTELAIVEDSKVIAVDKKNLDKIVLRESDVKTALWQPMLTSDDKGNVQVEFEAPNFNTTWITQAVAWDKKMNSGTWLAEVLTQKPLMVRSNMPRFLRQGDKATLAATVQNATDEAAACDAVIELFDPRTNEVYATRKFNLQLGANGSEAVTIDWQVPDTAAPQGCPRDAGILRQPRVVQRAGVAHHLQRQLSGSHPCGTQPVCLASGTRRRQGAAPDQGGSHLLETAQRGQYPRVDAAEEPGPQDRHPAGLTLDAGCRPPDAEDVKAERTF